VVEETFEREFEAECLRCGERIPVNAELVHGGPASAAGARGSRRLEEAITALAPADAETNAGEGTPTPTSPEGAPQTPDAGSHEGSADPGDSQLEIDGQAYGLQPDGKRRGPGRRYDEDEEEPIQGQEPKRPWALLAGIVAVVLLGGSLGGYYWFSRHGKAADKQTAEKKTKTTTNSKTSVAKTTTKSQAKTGSATAALATTKGAEKSANGAKKAEDQAEVTPASDAIIRLSAARLSAELAANPEETDRKYANATLEVSGLFDKIARRSAAKGPAPQYAVFAVKGCPISCELSPSPKDINPWRSLRSGKPFTVRGTYSKEGYLNGCELLPPSPPADEKYKGREMEVAGFVEQVLFADDRERLFPAIRLERATNGLVELDCFFRRAEEEPLRKLPPGTPITIKGTCNGRHTSLNGTIFVRLDNCQIIYTSTPASATPRIDATGLLHEYEEDLRRELLPAAGGTQERTESPVALSDLAREVAAGRGAVDKKYRNCFLAVSGKIVTRNLGDNVVELRSGETDQSFKVRCQFSKRNFGDLTPSIDQAIRGLCTGLSDDGATLTLENCEPFGPGGRRDPRPLTADYLPYHVGRNLTYDVATYPFPGRRESATLVRRTCYLREDGKAETVTTHEGVPVTRSLFEEPNPDRWLTHRKTRKVRTPGPTCFYRVFGGFVELGQDIVNKDGHVDRIWEPSLKLGARTGDSWRWTYANADHEYRVQEFTQHQSRPAVVILETVTARSDLHHPYAVRHVYVKDVGEVERRETMTVATGEKLVLAEKRLVEGSSGTPSPETKPMTEEPK
jgi:hypothetical protein